MVVRVNIFYPQLSQVVEKGEPLTLKGNTIIECLEDLIHQFPAARELLFDDQGQLIRNIFVYANEESLFQPGMDTPVKDGDTLIIASLITGG